jgi:hypothetical protein
MSLSHSVQIANKQNDSLNPIIQFLNTLNDVPQKYGSFEKAEQAIRELVVELEKSMVQETLSHYDINTPLLSGMAKSIVRFYARIKPIPAPPVLLKSSAPSTVQKSNAFAHWNYKPVLLRGTGRLWLPA